MRPVAFYSNHFAVKEGTGIARYARNLVQALAELDVPLSVVPVATWSNFDKNELKSVKTRTGLTILPTGRRFTQLLWLALGAPKLERLLRTRIDIVHASTLGHLVATSKPYVVTVHDLGPLTHPEFFRAAPSWFLKKHLDQAIQEVDAFICVSEATADALTAYVQREYSVDLSPRTHVVHEGVSESFLQPANSSIPDSLGDFNLPQPYILAVGKLSPRKNLESVIRALAQIRSVIPHHLVTVGGDGWDHEAIKALVHSHGLADRVHFLGYVSDEALRTLYRRAALFIYPSLFEGFGLPVLEAMASGCPVITSNISSLPEVAGNAALLVDPRNVEEIAGAIEAVCTSSSLATELRCKGQERATLFSWQTCATETLVVYENVCVS